MLAARHPAFQDELSPAGFPQRLEHHHGQPGTILQAAAKAVYPLVGPGRQKLVEQPAVAAVQAHPVKPRLLAKPGRLDEVGAQLLHVLFRHGPDEYPVPVGQLHGADGLLLPLDLALGLPHMAQLHQGQRPVVMDALGKLAVAPGVFLRLVVKAVELVGPTASRGGHRRLPHEEGRLSAPGPQVNLRQLFRVCVVALRVLVPDPAPRRAHYPAPVCVPRYPYRSQQMGIAFCFTAHILLPFRLGLRSHWDSLWCRTRTHPFVDYD